MVTPGAVKRRQESPPAACGSHPPQIESILYRPPSKRWKLSIAIFSSEKRRCTSETMSIRAVRGNAEQHVARLQIEPSSDLDRSPPSANNTNSAWQSPPPRYSPPPAAIPIAASTKIVAAVVNPRTPPVLAKNHPRSQKSDALHDIGSDSSGARIAHAVSNLHGKNREQRRAQRHT